MARTFGGVSACAKNTKNQCPSPTPHGHQGRSVGPPRDKRRPSKFDQDIAIAHARARGAELAHKWNMLALDDKAHRPPMSPIATKRCARQPQSAGGSRLPSFAESNVYAPQPQSACAEVEGHTSKFEGLPEDGYEQPIEAPDSNNDSLPTLPYGSFVLVEFVGASNEAATCIDHQGSDSSAGYDLPRVLGRCSPLILPKCALARCPEDSSNQTPTCSTTPIVATSVASFDSFGMSPRANSDTDFQHEDLGAVLRKKSADLDTVLRKSELLLAQLSALAEDSDNPAEGKHEEDVGSTSEDASCPVSACSSPMSRPRKPDTIEVPVGLLHAFSETVSQCEGLYHDLECLSVTNAKLEEVSSAFWDNQRFGKTVSGKQEHPGRDRLSSAISSSGDSTTDELGSSCSLESISTPQWLKSPLACSSSTLGVQSAQVLPSAFSARAISPSISSSMACGLSPTFGHGRLSKETTTGARSPSVGRPPTWARPMSISATVPVACPLTRVRPLSSSATVPVAVGPSRRLARSMVTPPTPSGGSVTALAYQQASPPTRCHPVAVNALLDALQTSGCRPKSCKVTQQQIVTITNTVHITVEV